MFQSRGVTLMSLTIYVVLLLITVAILATITSNFQGNIRNANKKGIEIAEINKFNMYFLQEVKRQGNDIKQPFNNFSSQITFTSGNIYRYDSNSQTIYLENEADRNKSIKIANNIEKCEFVQALENGKTIISVTITAINTESVSYEYVLNNQENSFTYEDEETYVYNYI
ncbi:MAG: hypothetical protein Q4G09_07570 [Clostridia bacterium]|nr:hypothetical protein [Clostridia bacterium]